MKHLLANLARALASRGFLTYTETDAGIRLVVVWDNRKVQP